ncbi:hypothetical protein K504DRAFT_180330 [Pleomassaria siparia CBS 279.74]|uniref:Amidohydrolase-related domain-containing protein n=1 Tax=Pleomassaria siparia CBS 279.74 TaxID=1314801 RepID=A0A6G1JSD7_9PLEO|nr:hypothetical protein K504DRAFT_180330 [Pleomassaria siparia CBS 279.74]
MIAATKVVARYYKLADRGVIAQGTKAELVLLKGSSRVNTLLTLDIAKRVGDGD